MNVNNLLSDLRTGVTVATTTIGTGLSTFLEWIPTDIGKLASVIGIVLSLILMRIHIMKGRMDREKLDLEIKLLKIKIGDERQV